MSFNNLDMSLFISDNSRQINNAISYLPTYSHITNPSFYLMMEQVEYIIHQQIILNFVLIIQMH